MCSTFHNGELKFSECPHRQMNVPSSDSSPPLNCCSADTRTRKSLMSISQSRASGDIKGVPARPEHGSSLGALTSGQCVIAESCDANGSRW